MSSKMQNEVAVSPKADIRPQQRSSMSTGGLNSTASCFSLEFSSKLDKVTVPHHDALKFPTGLTAECWVNLHQDCTGYLIAKKQSFALAVKKSALMVALNNVKPGWVWKNTKHVLDYQRWRHVALTYDVALSECNVYVDGRLVKKFDSMMGPLDITAENDMHFGLHLVQDFVCGMVSDVRVWRVAHDEAFIRRHMYTPPPEDHPGLVGWWPLSRGYGNTADDLSPNQLHGKIDGATWIKAGREVDPFPSTMRQDLGALINNPNGSDIKLRASEDTELPEKRLHLPEHSSNEEQVDDGNPRQLAPEHDTKGNFIYAHKAFLMTRCPVFEAMLSNDRYKEGSMPEVTIRDISFPALYKLIEYIYTDHVDMDGATVMELFQAADRFDLPRLRYYCEIFLLENISTENVCELLEAADRFGATLLRPVCMKWILDHYGDVMASDQFLSLNRKLMLEINQFAAKTYFESLPPPSKKRKQMDNE